MDIEKRLREIKKYYLAHPFDLRKKIRVWELNVELNTGINLINPFYELSREDIQDADEGVKNPRIKHYKDLVEDDLELIKNSDGFIAIIGGNNSIGTFQEMIYAYNWKKPIISIVTNGKQQHPWIKYHSTKIFTSYTDFEKWIYKNQFSCPQIFKNKV